MGFGIPTNTQNVALLLLLLLSAAPANAQTALQKPECDAAIIASTEQKIEAMKNGPQKQTAVVEIAAARQAMVQGKTEECQDHLLKAALQTK